MAIVGLIDKSLAPCPFSCHRRWGQLLAHIVSTVNPQSRESST